MLADERGWLAAFLLEDEPREDAAGLVAALAARGLALHLVSGDDPALVEALARRLGIESFAGGATPQDKFAFAERLQREGRVVAMIGDGLNDAPVLARADVSIAMGGGADAAKLQADLVLLGARLGAVAEAFGVARAAMRVVRQNFGWALAYNAVALPLAALAADRPLGSGARNVRQLVHRGAQRNAPARARRHGKPLHPRPGLARIRIRDRLGVLARDRERPVRRPRPCVAGPARRRRPAAEIENRGQTPIFQKS